MISRVAMSDMSATRYYNIHVKYILNILEAVGVDVEILDWQYTANTEFNVFIDGINCKFDFSDDHNTDYSGSGQNIFKFHCRKETEYVHAFPPVSFYNWPEYWKLQESTEYSHTSNTILFNQRAYGNATERRNTVKRMLEDRYSGKVDTFITPQSRYWAKASDCLCHVFVPGYCNNMLDRGQFQFMALGCPTISPRLHELLPFGQRPYPSRHYYMCRDDYSDLFDKIEMIREDRQAARDMGDQAKTLFQEISTPAKIVEWIAECL